MTRWYTLNSQLSKWGFYKNALGQCLTVLSPQKGKKKINLPKLWVLHLIFLQEKHGFQKHFPKFSSTMYQKVKNITQLISVFFEQYIKPPEDLVSFCFACLPRDLWVAHTWLANLTEWLYNRTCQATVTDNGKAEC